MLGVLAIWVCARFAEALHSRARAIINEAGRYAFHRVSIYLFLSFCVSVYPCSPHACNGAFVLTSGFRHCVSLSVCEGWARDMLVVCVFFDYFGAAFIFDIRGGLHGCSDGRLYLHVCI